MYLHQMAGLIEEITRLQMPPYAIEADQSVSWVHEFKHIAHVTTTLACISTYVHTTEQLCVC